MNRPRALAPWVVVGVGGWPLGAGALKARPGAYQIASNWDGRFGCPGPREVADLTGIASGYRVVKMLKHADTDVVIATNGTSTRVYRKETTWVTKVDQLDGGAQNQDLTGVATDAVSFKNVLAIAFGEGRPTSTPRPPRLRGSPGTLLPARRRMAMLSGPTTFLCKTTDF